MLSELPRLHIRWLLSKTLENSEMMMTLNSIFWQRETKLSLLMVVESRNVDVSDRTDTKVITIQTQAPIPINQNHKNSSLCPCPFTHNFGRTVKQHKICKHIRTGPFKCMCGTISISSRNICCWPCPGLDSGVNTLLAPSPNDQETKADLPLLPAGVIASNCSTTCPKRTQIRTARVTSWIFGTMNDFCWDLCQTS